MKNVGIIAEYNPLHNGHLYQMSGIDNNIIVAMSGNFTERGDVAVANKYTRAKLAIQHGASMVVEIPAFGVLSCAEHYAKCAVKVLDLLGNVDSINFGSECGDTTKLTKIAHLQETTDVKDRLSELLSSGMSYPRALASALSEISDDRGVAEIMSTPNNILGIEYIRALAGTDITPTTIRRCGSQYNEMTPSGEYASATSIRNNMHSDDIGRYLPHDVLTTIRDIHVDLDMLLHSLYTLLVVQGKDISDVLGVREGIDNRIRSALLESTTYDDLIDRIKTKRYTLSSIKRTLLDIVLDIPRDYSNRINDIDYVTVLAVRRDALPQLRECKAKIVTRYNDYKMTSHPFAALDLRADALYNGMSSDRIESHQMLIID